MWISSKPTGFNSGAFDDLGRIALQRSVSRTLHLGIFDHRDVLEQQRLIDLLLGPCKRTIYSWSLGALLFGPAQQTLVKLFFILPANPILQLTFALGRVLFHRSVHSLAVVKRFVDLIFRSIDSTSLRFSIDARDHRVGHIGTSVFFVICSVFWFLFGFTFHRFPLGAFGEEVIDQQVGSCLLPSGLKDRFVERFAR